MSKNKRMIYVWDENLDFYNGLTDKSEFLNLRMVEARQAADAPTQNQEAAQEQLEVPEKFPGYDHPDPRMRALRRDIWIKENRDRKRLAEARGE